VLGRTTVVFRRSSPPQRPDYEAGRHAVRDNGYAGYDTGRPADDGQDDVIPGLR